MKDKEALMRLYEIGERIDRIGKAAITGEISKEFRKNLFNIDEEYRELYEKMKKPFSLLILGSRYSIFIRKLIRNLKLFFFEDIKVNITSIENRKMYSSTDFHFFEDEYIPITLNEDSSSSFKRFYSKMKLLPGKLYEILNQTRPDVVNLHYLHYFWGFAKKALSDSKLVVTIWGSDMYTNSKNPVIKFLQKRILNTCSLVSVGNPALKSDFLKTYGNKYKSKVRIATFGTPIDLLLHDTITKDDIEKFKEKFGIPKDKRIVIVGSSADRFEHHMEILKALEVFKDDIFAVVPMTYGHLEYRDLVEKYLSDSNLKGLIIKNYLKDREMAVLKLISDMVIYLPKTDAFSAFLLESIYVENPVITGEWLPYSWIDENDIYVRRIKSPDIGIIRENVEDILVNLESERKKCRGNKEKILKIATWQYRFKDWLKLYHEVLNA